MVAQTKSKEKTRRIKAAPKPPSTDTTLRCPRCRAVGQVRMADIIFGVWPSHCGVVMTVVETKVDTLALLEDPRRSVGKAVQL